MRHPRARTIIVLTSDIRSYREFVAEQIPSMLNMVPCFHFWRLKGLVSVHEPCVLVTDGTCYDNDVNGQDEMQAIDLEWFTTDYVYELAAVIQIICLNDISRLPEIASYVEMRRHEPR